MYRASNTLYFIVVAIQVIIFIRIFGTIVEIGIL